MNMKIILIIIMIALSGCNCLRPPDSWLDPHRWEYNQEGSK